MKRKNKQKKEFVCVCFGQGTDLGSIALSLSLFLLLSLSLSFSFSLQFLLKTTLLKRVFFFLLLSRPVEGAEKDYYSAAAAVSFYFRRVPFASGFELSVVVKVEAIFIAMVEVVRRSEKGELVENEGEEERKTDEEKHREQVVVRVEESEWRQLVMSSSAAQHTAHYFTDTSIDLFPSLSFFHLS